jgi:hypothetical protein
MRSQVPGYVEDMHKRMADWLKENLGWTHMQCYSWFLKWHRMILLIVDCEQVVTPYSVINDLLGFERVLKGDKK